MGINICDAQLYNSRLNSICTFVSPSHKLRIFRGLFGGFVFDYPFFTPCDQEQTFVLPLGRVLGPQKATNRQFLVMNQNLFLLSNLTSIYDTFVFIFKANGTINKLLIQISDSLTSMSSTMVDDPGDEDKLANSKTVHFFRRFHLSAKTRSKYRNELRRIVMN